MLKVGKILALLYRRILVSVSHFFTLLRFERKNLFFTYVLPYQTNQSIISSAQFICKVKVSTNDACQIQ